MKKLFTAFLFLSFIIFNSITSCSEGDGGSLLKGDGSADLEFTNEVYTPIQITVGDETRTIPMGGSTTFHFDENPGLVDYYATTSGRTTTNTVIGLELEWDFNIDLDGSDFENVPLFTGSDFFYLQYRNNTGTDYSRLYVNYQQPDQTLDNILLPSNGVNYNTGYYRANSGNKIRVENQSLSWWLHTEGINFDYPSGKNKRVQISAGGLGKQGVTGNSLKGMNPNAVTIKLVTSSTQNKAFSRSVSARVK